MKIFVRYTHGTSRKRNIYLYKSFTWQHKATGDELLLEHVELCKGDLDSRAPPSRRSATVHATVKVASLKVEALEQQLVPRDVTSLCRPAQSIMASEYRGRMDETSARIVAI